MFARKFFTSIPIFALLYLLQESFFNQFRLFGGGVSIFLIFTLLWSSLGPPELGALTGFGAGLMMDLSQTSSGPMGQWTLIMILAGFTISYLGIGDNNFRSSPFSLILIILAGVVLTRFIYLILGLLLGREIGSLWSIVLSLSSSALWTVATVPLLTPVVTRIYETLFEVKTHK